MAIDPSLFSQAVSIPSANSMLNPAPSAASYANIHSALSSLPDATTISSIPLPSSFSLTSTGTGDGSTGATGTTVTSPYASDVTDEDVLSLQASLSTLQGIHSSGDLQNLSSITTSMTSQVVGTSPSIPSAWLSQVGTTSSLTASMGTPNAMSLLSAQQSAQSLANQMQGNTNPSNPQTCGITADITGAIKSVQSGLSTLYQDASAGLKSVEQSIGNTVSSAASMVKGLVTSNTSGGTSGSGGSSGTITKSQIQSVVSDVSSAYQTISSEVKSAISTVVGTVDGMAVAIENQIKLGVANAINAIKSDPCFGALASKMTGASLSSVISAQTGLDTAKQQVIDQQAQQAAKSKACAAIAEDYPAATTANLNDLVSQVTQAQADLASLLKLLNAATDALNAQIESTDYQTVKNNQNSSAAAMLAYQQAKTAMQSSSVYTDWQAKSNAYNAQNQVVSTLRSFYSFMLNKGQIPSNPNGPWYTAANTTANPPVPGTVTGKLP